MNDADVVWDKSNPNEWVARVGHATFRYHPDEQRMVWRGRSYRGVAPHDINQFVQNRRDR